MVILLFFDMLLYTIFVTYLKLSNISSYKISSDLSDFVWNVVMKWGWFEKKTLGDQFVRSIGSIAANIAEGFGRYHKKDKQRFYYNARASVYESIFWSSKAFKRNLVQEKDYVFIASTLYNLPKEINALVRYTENKLTI